MTTAQIWSLPAGARAAELVREGGRCAVYGKRYDVELEDGRRFEGCGLEGDPAPASVVGRRHTLVLCSIPGSDYSLVTPSIIVSAQESSP